MARRKRDEWIDLSAYLDLEDVYDIDSAGFEIGPDMQSEPGLSLRTIDELLEEI